MTFTNIYYFIKIYKSNSINTKYTQNLELYTVERKVSNFLPYNFLL